MSQRSTWDIITEKKSLSSTITPYLLDMRAFSKVETEDEGGAPARWIITLFSPIQVKRAKKSCSRIANNTKGYRTLWCKTKDVRLALRGTRSSKQSQRMLKQNLDGDYKSIAENRDGINRNQSIAIVSSDASR